MKELTHMKKRAAPLFLAVLTIVGNLLADVLYAWADPRIRVRS